MKSQKPGTGALTQNENPVVRNCLIPKVNPATLPALGESIDWCCENLHLTPPWCIVNTLTDYVNRESGYY